MVQSSGEQGHLTEPLTPAVSLGSQGRLGQAALGSDFQHQRAAPFIGEVEKVVVQTGNLTGRESAGHLILPGVQLGQTPSHLQPPLPSVSSEWDADLLPL